MNDFGFTNEEGKYKAVVKFREDAIADGWECKPTYGSSESIESHATLAKEGFTCHVKARIKKEGKWKYEAEVTIWGSDGLVISGMPLIYNWEEIKAGLKRCNYCLRNGVEIQRLGFAGRCCKECLSAQQKIIEYPGWTK